MLTLVLGGMRSGKSRYAESLVVRSGLGPVYVATACPDTEDQDLLERIAAHRKRRDGSWRTVEAEDLAGVLERTLEAGSMVLVDCVALWLGRVMSEGGVAEEAMAGLCAVVERCETPLVLVSQEVGLGMVAMSGLGRGYQDALGLLNQRLAELADEVVLVAAGCPLRLKPPAGVPPA